MSRRLVLSIWIGVIVAGVLLVFRGQWLLGFTLVVVTGALSSIGGTWRRTSASRTFSNCSVSELQSDLWGTVSEEATLSEIVHFQAIQRGIGSFVVKRGGRVCGFLALKTIESVPRTLWATIRAGDVMTRISELRPVSPATKLSAVLQEISAKGADRIPVVANDEIVSVVSIDTIRRAAEKESGVNPVRLRRESRQLRSREK